MTLRVELAKRIAREETSKTRVKRVFLGQEDFDALMLELEHWAPKRVLDAEIKLDSSLRLGEVRFA